GRFADIWPADDRDSEGHAARDFAAEAVRLLRAKKRISAGESTRRRGGGPWGRLRRLLLRRRPGRALLLLRLLRLRRLGLRLLPRLLTNCPLHLGFRLGFWLFLGLLLFRRLLLRLRISGSSRLTRRGLALYLLVAAHQ